MPVTLEIQNVFEFATFRSNSLQVTKELKMIFVEPGDQVILDVQTKWNNLAMMEFVPLYDYFMGLVNKEDDKYFTIIPIVTTIANLERLITVLINSSNNALVKDIKKLMPERYGDFLAIINLFESQITKLIL